MQVHNMDELMLQMVADECVDGMAGGDGVKFRRHLFCHLHLFLFGRFMTLRMKSQIISLFLVALGGAQGEVGRTSGRHPPGYLANWLSVAGTIKVNSSFFLLSSYCK